MLAVLALAACGTGTAEEPAPVRSSAAEAPTAIAHGERELVLGAYAWRDGMPALQAEATEPCDSVCVNGTIEDVAGDPLPPDVEVLEVIAIAGGREYAFREQELRGFELTDRQYEFWVGGGPAIDPAADFDLAVRFVLAGRQRWLRADDVTLGGTTS